MATNLTMEIFGVDKSASETLTKVGDAAQKTSGHMDSIGSASSKAGGLAKTALGMLGGFAIGEKIKESTDKFEEYGEQIKQLRIVTGGSVEDASRLSTAMQMSGIDAQAGQMDMIRFSKGLETAGTTAKGTAKMTALLGTNFKDAHGNILPMAELLPKVADHFKDMPDGAAKTALAVQLFGRSGVGMIEMLDKGSEGMKEMGAKSDSLGLTLNDKSMAAMENAKEQSRNFTAALSGLTTSIGGALMPILTMLAGFMTDTVIPAVSAVVGWMKEHAQIVGIVAGVLGSMFVIFKGFKMLDGAITSFKLMNTVMRENPIMMIIVAIGLLVAGFMYLWNNSEAFRNFWKGLWAGIQAVFKTTWEVITGIFDWVSAFIKKWGGVILLVIAPFIGIPLLIIKNWGKISSFFSELFGAIKDVVVTVFTAIGDFLSGIWGTISSVASSAWLGIQNFIVTPIKDAWEWIQSTLGGIASWFGGIFSDAATAIQNAWTGITGFFSGIWDDITSGFHSAINAMIDVVNGLIGGVNTVVHGINFINPFSPIPDIPSISYLAAGGPLLPGLTMVGEQGPELLSMAASGGHVFSNSQSRSMLGGAGGGDVIHIHMEGFAIGTADEFARRAVDALQQARRRGTISKGALTLA